MIRASADDFIGRPSEDLITVQPPRVTRVPDLHQAPPEAQAHEPHADLAGLMRRAHEAQRIERELREADARIRPWDRPGLKEALSEAIAEEARMRQRFTNELAPGALKARQGVERLEKMARDAVAHAEKAHGDLEAARKALAEAFATGDDKAQSRAIDKLDASSLTARKADLAVQGSETALNAAVAALGIAEEASRVTIIEVDLASARIAKLMAWTEAKVLAEKVAKLVAPLLERHSAHTAEVREILAGALK